MKKLVGKRDFNPNSGKILEPNILNECAMCSGEIWGFFLTIC